MKYVCPKCGTVIQSEVKLEYCVCGGKYEDVMGMLWKDLGLDDVFDSFNGKEKA